MSFRPARHQEGTVELPRPTQATSALQHAEAPPSKQEETLQGVALFSIPEARPLDASPFPKFPFTDDVKTHVVRMMEDAISSITRNRSYFREKDVVQGVWRKAERELAHEPAILEHPQFGPLIEATVAHRPLITIGSSRLLTTPTMASEEMEMLRLAGAQTEQHMLPYHLVEKAIAERVGISEEQVDAVLAATRTHSQVTVIEGTAGAGKSFTMKAIKDAFQWRGYEVMGTALSWNAAKVLGASTGLDNCIALEGLTRAMDEARRAGTQFFRTPTLLIVDEAGMVGTRHMVKLLREAHHAHVPVKVVLTGDSLQVNPVDAGNALQAIIAFHGTTRIDTIRRQRQASHRRAVKLFSQRYAGRALYTFQQQECLHWCNNADDMLNLVVRDFVSYRHAHPDKRALILALRNKDVAELNRRIRVAYKKMGLLSMQEVVMDVTDGRETWKSGFSVGDEVVVRANNKDSVIYALDPNMHPTDEASWTPIRKGIFNRNAGRLMGIKKGVRAGTFDFIINLEGEEPGRVIINSKDLRHPDRPGLPMVHNFATTIYASQGQTVNKVFMLDSPLIEFRLAYVGNSRHTEGLEIYLDEHELHQRLDKALGRQKDAIRDRGRYTRGEMLQAVASCWARPSENLTVSMFDKFSRLGRPVEEKMEVLAKVEAGSREDEQVDFLPELNTRIPVVDIASLLTLPDEPLEASLILPSSVTEANEAEASDARLPHHAVLPPPIPALDAAAKTASTEGWWKSAKKWLGGSEPVQPPPPPTRISTAVLEPLSHAPQGKKTIKIPICPLPPSMGHITEEGCLAWDNVPGTTLPAAIAVTGPNPDSVKALRGLLWDVGRGNEPRILARDQRGRIVARYRLDGACVVGEGYPPMRINPAGTPETPVVIVPGAKEWFWYVEHQAQRCSEEPSRIPHALWAAKDADWTLIASALKTRQVTLVRSKYDQSQAQWAEDLSRRLAALGITTTVTPPLPGSAPLLPVEAAPLAPSVQPSVTALPSTPAAPASCVPAEQEQGGELSGLPPVTAAHAPRTKLRRTPR